jgi:hypothetical protein
VPYRAARARFAAEILCPFGVARSAIRHWLVQSSVCYKSGVEVMDDFGLFVAKNHPGVFGSITFPLFLVNWENLLLICFLI